MKLLLVMTHKQSLSMSFTCQCYVEYAPSKKYSKKFFVLGLLTSYSFHQMEDSSETSNQPENGEKIQAINEENIAKAAASALAAAAVKAKVTID